MLSDEDNEMLTRVGPGTPLGTLIREYWIPAMLSWELPVADCDPVRVMLLGERLVAFRDSSCRVGLIQNNCPHRGASLFFGRNEEGGIRCVYHGWKFDTTGACIDMPNEPADADFKARVKATTYPCIERAGIVWTYMGPRRTPPPVPLHEALDLPEGQYYAGAALRSCNWLQGLEGDLDASHLYCLHFGMTRLEDTEPGTAAHHHVRTPVPHYVACDTAYGTMYGACRPAGPGENYWRIAQYLFPFYTHIAAHRSVLLRMWVPMDDGHTMFYTLDRRSLIPSSGEGASAGEEPFSSPTAGVADHQSPRLIADVNDEPCRLRPNSSDWFGRFRLVADAANDYLLDREVQRTDTFTGIPGIFTQDHAITESMGAIVDRTAEHVGTADIMIIRTRRRLLKAVQALVAHQEIPPGVDEPQLYRTRSASCMLPQDADWIEATEKLRAPENY